MASTITTILPSHSSQSSPSKPLRLPDLPSELINAILVLKLSTLLHLQHDMAHIRILSEEWPHGSRRDSHDIVPTAITEADDLSHAVIRDVGDHIRAHTKTLVDAWWRIPQTFFHMHALRGTLAAVRAIVGVLEQEEPSSADAKGKNEKKKSDNVGRGVIRYNGERGVIMNNVGSGLITEMQFVQTAWKGPVEGFHIEDWNVECVVSGKNVRWPVFHVWVD